jgi:hypothetical protein
MKRWILWAAVLVLVVSLGASSSVILSRQRSLSYNPYLASFVDASGNPLHGIRYTHKFGDTSETTLGDFYDVWDCPSLAAGIPDLYPWIDGTTPISIYAMSDDDADTALTVLVQGLDANWDRVSEVVVLGVSAGTGTTAALVGTASNWTRVHRAYVVGATGLTGNLYLSPSATDATGDGIPDVLTDLAACIVAGSNQTLMAIYTTADEEVSYIVKRCVSGVDTTPGTPGSATMAGSIRLEGGVFRRQDVLGLHANGTSQACIESSMPFFVPPRTDIRAVIIAADGLNRVAASFDIVEIGQ